MVRDGYLADSLCESCTGTVDLQLTTRPGYDGLSVHEVVAGARGMLRLEEAVRNSRVLCKTCMGGNYGHAGALAKVRLKMAREAAGRMQGG